MLSSVINALIANLVPKHFPFSKGFLKVAKGKMLGPVDPSGENKGDFCRGLAASLNIPNSNICETRLYFEFTATNRMSGKNLRTEKF